jgi:hypothetical protein
LNKREGLAESKRRRQERETPKPKQTPKQQTNVLLSDAARAYLKELAQIMGAELQLGRALSEGQTLERLLNQEAERRKLA